MEKNNIIRQISLLEGVYDIHDARFENGIPADMLPSYVDDVIEGYLYNTVFYEDIAQTKPIKGAPGVIYVDLISDKIYRWSGSVYIEIVSGNIALSDAIDSTSDATGNIAATPKAISTLKALIDAKSDFSGSWNDLTDKPFGETTDTVGSDTLTWDGNTEGLVSAETGEFTFYKIADDVFSDEQIKTMTISASIGQTFVVADLWEQAQGVSIFVAEDYTIAMMMACIRKDGVVYDNVIFPEKGLYVASIPDAFYIDRITSTDPIFTTTATTVKPIEEKYIPDTIARTIDVDTQLANKADISTVPTKLSDLADDATHRLVTDAEKAIWSAKSDFSGSWNDLADKPDVSVFVDKTYVDSAVSQKTQVQIITWEADD